MGLTVLYPSLIFTIVHFTDEAEVSHFSLSGSGAGLEGSEKDEGDTELELKRCNLKVLWSATLARRQLETEE